MNKLLTLTLISLGALTLAAAEEQTEACAKDECAAKEVTKAEKVEVNMKDVSYTIGFDSVKAGKEQNKIVLNPEKVAEGYKDGFAKKSPAVKQEEIQEAHQKYLEFSKEKADKVYEDPGTLSYYNGYTMGVGFVRMQMASLDADSLIAGMKDAKEGKEPKFNDDKRKEIMAQFEQAAMEKQQELLKAQQEKAAKIKEESKKFLEENAKKEGVKVTESGLQYTIIKEGEGAKPKATDTVKVHYKGTLTDGTEFDSSYKRGEPISFPLNGVIKGWTEGLQLMPVGSTYRFFIPSDLGYGDRGAGADIPGGAALIFDVELIDINPGK